MFEVEYIVDGEILTPTGVIAWNGVPILRITSPSGDIDERLIELLVRVLNLAEIEVGTNARSSGD